MQWCTAFASPHKQTEPSQLKSNEAGGCRHTVPLPTSSQHNINIKLLLKFTLILRSVSGSGYVTCEIIVHILILVSAPFTFAFFMLSQSGLCEHPCKLLSHTLD